MEEGEVSKLKLLRMLTFAGGGRGGFGGGGRQSFGGRGAQIQTGPPDHVLGILQGRGPKLILEMGRFVHACEGDMVYEATLAQKIPYFNSQIYFQDKVPSFPIQDGGTNESNTLAK